MKGRQRTERVLSPKLLIDFTRGEHDVVDFFATALTCTASTFVGEIKDLLEKGYERSLRKYENYMIDWAKINLMREIARNDGRRAILIVFFTDYTVIWDVTDMDVDSRRKWRWVNKDGQNYGKRKEWQLMTFLYENEAIWIKRTEEEQQTTRP